MFVCVRVFVCVWMCVVSGKSAFVSECNSFSDKTIKRHQPSPHNNSTRGSRQPTHPEIRTLLRAGNRRETQRITRNDPFPFSLAFSLCVRTHILCRCGGGAEKENDTGSDSGDRAPHSQESEMTEGERERESERESKVVTFWASPPLCE